MKYLHIDSQLFINNRREFSKKLKENTLAIFNSNDIMPTNADGTMPFRQNNDLFWLSGVDQEESVLIICPNYPDKDMQEILFLKETNEHIAIWEGAKLTKDDAFKTSGIKTIFWLNELESKLAELISKTDAIYLNKNIHSRAASKVQTRDDRFRLMIAEKFSDKEIKEAAPIMHELRVIKSEQEIDSEQEIEENSKALNEISEKEKTYRNLLGLKSKGPVDSKILENNYQERVVYGPNVKQPQQQGYKS